jgi:hypothetical protein
LWPRTTTCCAAGCAATGPDPVREVDGALRLVISLYAAPADASGDGSTIVAFRTSQDINTLIPALRQLTEERSGL